MTALTFRATGMANRELWLWGGLLVLLVLVVYAPSVGNGFVSDDVFYIQNNAALDSLAGLRNIWFRIGTIEQYYPLVHSMFWVEHHLWGNDPRGYHIINLLLHALTAILVWRLLDRLQVPGAWLAAAIFTVHPLEVASVAWASERKNLLSCTLAVGSILAYLRFSPPERAQLDDQAPQQGGWSWYAVALALYVGAVLSKSVAASVPAVLLAIYWWKRGGLRWREAVRLAPFFAVGLALGLLTVWMERTYVLAHGEQWELSPIERVLIAGRALWFYAGKLVWPSSLIFFYPRWEVDTGAWWQYLFPAGALLFVSGLWLAKDRVGRGPLAAMLIFAGVLVPALGFFNIYAFRYAFVANHYQYHAGIALIALIVAAGTTLVQRQVGLVPRLAPWAAGALLCVLSLTALAHTRDYRNDIVLFEAIAACDPESWVAHNALGNEYRKLKDYDRSMYHWRRTIEIRERSVSDHPAVVAYRYELAGEHLNLAMDQRAAGLLDQSLINHRKALQLREALVHDQPAVDKYHNDLAASYVDVGMLEEKLARPTEAENAFRQAIEIRERLVADNIGQAAYQDGLAGTYQTLARFQQEQRRFSDAETSCRRAIEIQRTLVRSNPTVINYQNTLAQTCLLCANIQRSIGHLDDAEASFREAIEARAQLTRDNPTVANYRNQLAGTYLDLSVLLRDSGRPADALAACQKAVDLRRALVQEYPRVSDYQSDLGWSYANLGIAQLVNTLPAEAVSSCEKAIEIRERLVHNYPGDANFRQALGWGYANLGAALLASGRPADAEASHRSAIAIREALVRDHPDRADFKNELAISHNDLKVARTRTLP